MRALANGTATGTPAADDPTRTVIDAVRKSLADLDGYPVADMVDDVEMAEAIGRLKSLTGILVSVVDR